MDGLDWIVMILWIILSPLDEAYKEMATNEKWKMNLESLESLPWLIMVYGMINENETSHLSKFHAQMDQNIK